MQCSDKWEILPRNIQWTLNSFQGYRADIPLRSVWSSKIQWCSSLSRSFTWNRIIFHLFGKRSCDCGPTVPKSSILR
jgi:hypothetical protein